MVCFECGAEMGPNVDYRSLVVVDGESHSFCWECIKNILKEQVRLTNALNKQGDKLEEVV